MGWLKPSDLLRGMLMMGGGVVWEDVSAPDAAFAYVPFTIQKSGSLFRPGPSFDLQAHANITVAKTYYVKTDGNDGASGADEANALATISAALLKADVDRIMVKAGLYAGAAGWNSQSPARNIEVIGYGGTVISSPHTTGLSWSAVGAHYTAAIAACNYALDASVVDVNGDYQVLTLKASEAEVDATPGSWYFAAGTVYVHTSDSRLPDADVWVYGTVGNGLGNDPVVYYIEGIDFYGGTGAFAFAEADVAAKLYLKNCEFKYGYSGNGLRIQGLGEVIAQDCIAALNKVDGFKAEELATIGCNMILINPISYSNGTSATTSANGYSRHDDGATVIINGEIWGNWGRNIQSTNTGSGSPLEWFLGLNCHDPATTDANADINFSIAGVGSKQWLDSCISSGATDDLEEGTDGTLYYRNLTSDGNFVGTPEAY